MIGVQVGTVLDDREWTSRILALFGEAFHKGPLRVPRTYTASEIGHFRPVLLVLAIFYEYISLTESYSSIFDTYTHPHFLFPECPLVIY